MDDDATPDAGGTYREPQRWLAAAWLALTWERLWPALWPATGVAGLFLALAWFDVLPVLPGWLHLVLLVGFGCGLVAALALGLRALRLPGRAAARRRVERDSDLAHRPLTGLLDAQAGGTEDPVSRALWRHHLGRLRASSGRLRVAWPRPGLAERDPMALRGLVALLLVVAAIGARDDWMPRIERSMTPSLSQASAAAPPRLDLIVTPPAYTRIVSFYLRDEQADPQAPGETAEVAVPANSTLQARVTGGRGQPVLWLGDRREDFRRTNAGSAQTEVTVTGGDRIAVEQDGRLLASWPMRVVPDAAPEIAFEAPPSSTERAALRIAYQASDDYGIEHVSATLRLPPAAPEWLARTPIDLELTVPGLAPRDASAVGFFDLTPHPWAGQTVYIRLSATDGAGQTGQSATREIVLPEREFRHPVARAIIDQRRTLMIDPRRADEVAETLETLALRPDRFYDDVVVFLALRTAGRRLMHHRGEAAAVVDPVQRLLWDTALRLEDGEVSLAERDLRQAEQALMDALAGNASDAEIQRLTEALRNALDRYLKALEEDLRARMARGDIPESMPFDPRMQVIDRDRLQEMLDQLQALSQSGARDAAQQLLTQLRDLLENLQTGLMAQQQGHPAMQMLEDLQNLMGAQQQLLDQTFQQAQPGAGERPMPGGTPRPGGPGDSQPGGAPNERSGSADGAAVQEALRRALGELMLQMGELGGDIPVPMGQAEQAMREAEDALRQGMPGAAVGPQAQALDRLQQGFQGLLDQLLEQMAEGGGVGPGQMPWMGRTDPLGRDLPNIGGVDTGDVEIPAESEIQRARQVLDELRRRLGERHRPSLEHDYIERLLRRF